MCECVCMNKWDIPKVLFSSWRCFFWKASSGPTDWLGIPGLVPCGTSGTLCCRRVCSAPEDRWFEGRVNELSSLQQSWPPSTDPNDTHDLSNPESVNDPTKVKYLRLPVSQKWRSFSDEMSSPASSKSSSHRVWQWWGAPDCTTNPEYNFHIHKLQICLVGDVTDDWIRQRGGWCGWVFSPLLVIKSQTGFDCLLFPDVWFLNAALCSTAETVLLTAAYFLESMWTSPWTATEPLVWTSFIHENSLQSPAGERTEQTAEKRRQIFGFRCLVHHNQRRTDVRNIWFFFISRHQIWFTLTEQQINWSSVTWSNRRCWELMSPNEKQWNGPFLCFCGFPSVCVFVGIKSLSMVFPKVCFCFSQTDIWPRVAESNLLVASFSQENKLQFCSESF